MDLSGKMLIAMPGMGDPRFERSLVYICSHSDEGAMGLIVNQAAGDVSFSELLSQLSITAVDGAPDVLVHIGGPVEHGRGFVLHSADYQATEATLQINADFGMTATLDVLEDIARGDGPKQVLMALGYAGWGPGQLEDEIQRNGWLTCEGDRRLVFDLENDHKWTNALQSIGVDPRMLSGTAGSA